ncbi:MAG: globin [Burkholderiales bacterium]
MNTELIAETWGAIDDPVAFVKGFYARFFERFPGYRPLFPQQLDPKHLEKMVQTMALVARMSEDRRMISPHVQKLGAAHKPYALEPKDLANFKAVFIEMLGQRLGATWSPAAAQAWDQAFEKVIIPLMREGAG